MPPPSDALARFDAALRAGDADTAYEMLHPEVRAQTSRTKFRALVRDNRTELLEQSNAIDRQLARGVEARARVPLENGETATLVLEGGEWRIAGDVLDAPVLHTPEDAVAALRHALERRSLRGFLRVLARQQRAELEADIARIIEQTEDEADLDVVVQGNEARIRTTGGGEIVLVREAGEWHVVDVR